VKLKVATKGVANFTQEEFDTLKITFEDNWIIFQTEFDEIVKVKWCDHQPEG
jgi:hypothetical protein